MSVLSCAVGLLCGSSEKTVKKSKKIIEKSVDIYPQIVYTIKRAKELNEKSSSRSADVAELAYAHDSGSCPG